MARKPLNPDKSAKKTPKSTSGENVDLVKEFTPSASASQHSKSAKKRAKKLQQHRLSVNGKIVEIYLDDKGIIYERTKDGVLNVAGLDKRVASSIKDLRNSGVITISIRPASNVGKETAASGNRSAPLAPLLYSAKMKNLKRAHYYADRDSDGLTQVPVSVEHVLPQSKISMKEGAAKLIGGLTNIFYPTEENRAGSKPLSALARDFVRTLETITIPDPSKK